MKKLKKLRARYRSELLAAASVAKSGAEALLLVQEARTKAPLALVKFIAEAVEGVVHGPAAHSEFYMGWAPLCNNRVMVDSLESVLKNIPVKILSDQGASHVLQITVDGVDFRFSREGMWSAELKCREDDVEQGLHVLRRIFWAQFQGCAALSQRPEDAHSVVAIAGDLSYAKATPRGVEIAERCKLYTREGVSRAYLFDGPPGTGKSTAAAYVASQVGERVLTVRPDTLDTMRGILDLVRSIKPDVVIIDELDRSQSHRTQMSVWEALRRLCPVILATTNNTDALDFGMLRPGRFDDVYVFTGIPDNVRDTILEGLPEHMRTVYFNSGVQLSPAYLAEWVTRYNIEGHKGSMAALQDLQERQQNIDAHSTD